MQFQARWADLGVVSRDELEAAGIDHRVRRVLVEQGQLHRFAPKVYLFGDAPAGEARWRQLAAAALLANGPGAVLSRSAAAALWSLDGFEPPVSIHVNVPQTSSRRGPRVHRVVSSAPAMRAGVPVTAVAQTLVELGTGLRARPRFEGDRDPLKADELVELALESALRRGLVREADLVDAAASLTTARQGPAILTACLARRPLGAPPTDSYLETRGIQVLRRSGLPTGQRQAALHDDRGAFIARVDLLLPGRLVIEFDGREHHARTAAFERDRARWDSIVAAGYRLLVFTAGHVERRPTFVNDMVSAALGGRARLRPAG